MKIRKARFGRFMVTLLSMEVGEERLIPPNEISRGIAADSIAGVTSDPKAVPLNPISIFTKGAFEVYRGDTKPYPVAAGDGGFRFAITDSVDNFRLRAIEEGSEYHCILPLERTARYWHRSGVNCAAGDSFELTCGQFLYVASGSVDLAGKTFTGPAMMEITEDRTARAVDRVVGVRMWI